MQLDSRLTAWPTVSGRAGSGFRTHSNEGQEGGKAASVGLGRGSLLVFQCGRVGANDFVCDFTPKVISNVQAFCIALSSLMHKPHYLWS